MTAYRLDVTVTPDLTNISGQADIRYTNREATPLDTVYLHLYPNLWDGGMAVTDAQVNGEPVSVMYPSGDDVIGLPLAVPLAPGESVELALRFALPVPSGEGVGNYGEFALQDGVLSLAHFYPTVAVYDTDWRLETPAPHGDVIFQDASLYDVTLTAPADLTVVATGATLGKTDNGDGSATWRLGGGPMRDFNVVASRDYLSASAQVGGMIVNSYFLPGDEEGGRQALDWAAKALTIYQKEFGAYPYRELDVVETGTTAGGIEYPGLVVVASRLYSDPARRAFFESATVHEVAHQWWYNVVGNDQVNHPWLDEALAQYATYRYFQNTYGDAGGKGFVDALNSVLDGRRQGTEAHRLADGQLYRAGVRRHRLWSRAALLRRAARPVRCGQDHRAAAPLLCRTGMGYRDAGGVSRAGRGNRSGKPGRPVGRVGRAINTATARIQPAPERKYRREAQIGADSCPP